MGSLKKKFARTLRKITPKEIAPILPILSMAIPGMQGLTPFMKFMLPQLLTAAGSARQTGKINLMNQALTGIGSLASINATNAAGANLDAAKAAGEGANAVYVDTLGNTVAGANNAGNAQALAADFAKAKDASNLVTAVDPKLYGNNLTNFNYNETLNPNYFNQGINSVAQTVGNNQFLAPLGNALSGDKLDMAKILAIGGTGGSMATADYAGKKQLEFEEEEAENEAKIGNYRDAYGALTNYFANQDYNLEDLYGVGNVPSFLLAANGGRAQLANGGMSPGERNARAGHQNENSGGGTGSGSGGGNGHPNMADISGPVSGNPTGGDGSGNGNGNGNNVYGPQPDPNAITIDKAVVNLDPITPNYDYYRNDDEEDYGVVGNYIKDIIENKGISLTDNLDLGINSQGLELDYGFADGGRIGFSDGGDRNAAGKDGSAAPKKKNAYNPAEGLPEGLGQSEIYRAYMDQLPEDNPARQAYFNTGFVSLPQTSTAVANNNNAASNYANTIVNNNNDVLDSIAYMENYNPFANNNNLFAKGGRIGFSEGSGPDMDRVLELEEQGFSYEEAFEKAMQERRDRGYAAGGRIGFSEGSNPDMDRVIELEQQGFSYEEAFEIAMKELMNRDYNANGGRIGLANGGTEGIMGAMQAPGVPAGMELDYRDTGGFIPMGGPEKADDVPAMLSKNEFVMTADAVRGLGNGDIESGAQQMYDLMNNLEAQA
jgi:hypothetical protein